MDVFSELSQLNGRWDLGKTGSVIANMRLLQLKKYFGSLHAILDNKANTFVRGNAKDPLRVLNDTKARDGLDKALESFQPSPPLMLQHPQKSILDKLKTSPTCYLMASKALVDTSNEFALNIAAAEADFVLSTMHRELASADPSKVILTFTQDGDQMMIGDIDENGDRIIAHSDPEKVIGSDDSFTSFKFTYFSQVKFFSYLQEEHNLNRSQVLVLWAVLCDHSCHRPRDDVKYYKTAVETVTRMGESLDLLQLKKQLIALFSSNQVRSIKAEHLDKAFLKQYFPIVGLTNELDFKYEILIDDDLLKKVETYYSTIWSTPVSLRDQSAIHSAHTLANTISTSSIMPVDLASGWDEAESELIRNGNIENKHIAEAGTKYAGTLKDIFKWSKSCLER